MLSNGDWGGRLKIISFAIKRACRSLKIAQVVANEEFAEPGNATKILDWEQPNSLRLQIAGRLFSFQAGP